MFVLQPCSTAVKAVAVSPNMTKVGRVTQTLLILCEAQGNMDDTSISFTWKKGIEVLQRSNEVAVSGRAASVLKIEDLSVEEYHGETIQCHPSNSFGGDNFTEFLISVELFPAPDIVSFRFDRDSPDMVVAAWHPVNITVYPEASFDSYYFEISRDNGSDIVGNGTVAVGNISFIFSLGDEYSDGFWVRIKAVKGDQDVSAFSAWFPVESLATRAPAGE